jgi:SnoaL-like domain
MAQVPSMDENALLAANAAYYRAFAAHDIAAMEAIWAEEGATCVHPGWPALVTRAAVIASYRDIFRNPAQDAVTARDERTLIDDAGGRVFCVEEVGGGLLLATNWFRLIDGRWRLLHHQASPLAPVRPAPQEAKRSFH